MGNSVRLKKQKQTKITNKIDNSGNKQQHKFQINNDKIRNKNNTENKESEEKYDQLYPYLLIEAYINSLTLNYLNIPASIIQYISILIDNSTKLFKLLDVQISQKYVNIMTISIIFIE